ncbi:MAG: hypothetical protein KC731_33535 [Myxococcales bacterium]|nr:hypothetical protein [Myxococcales bacterium]
MRRSMFIMGALVLVACDPKPSTPPAPSSAATTQPATTASATVAEAVSFGRHDIQPGMKYTAKTHTVSVEQEARLVVDCEVVAVDRGRVVKSRMRFAEARMTSTRDGETKVDPLPVEGNTYEVERIDGKLVVTKDGAQVTDDGELQWASVDIDGAGTSLPTRPLRPGEKVEELAKREGDTTYEVTFDEREGNDGVFRSVLTSKTSSMKILCSFRARIEDGRMVSHECRHDGTTISVSYIYP